MLEPQGELMKALLEIAEAGVSYIGFVLMAIAGGTAHYISQINRKKKIFSFVEFIGELFIAGFTGLLTALACESQGMSMHWIVICSSMAGHMGSRLTFMVEVALIKYLQRTYPVLFNKDEE